MYDVTYKKRYNETLALYPSFYRPYSLKKGQLELLSVVYRSYNEEPANTLFKIRIFSTKKVVTGYLWWRKVESIKESKELIVSADTLTYISETEYLCNQPSTTQEK